jgi:triacylglycerol esterase/lipase EstA (alpha/beta hydrolase family)
MIGHPSRAADNGRQYSRVMPSTCRKKAPKSAKTSHSLGVLVALLLASGCAGDTPTEADLATDEVATDIETQARFQGQAQEPARPIVLVAGLLQDNNTVAPLAKALRARGLDVTVWVPPNLGLDDIDGNVGLLGRTVEGVRRRTRAAKVDLVGHSQGGVTARRYVQLAGGDAPVETLVSLGSPQQGTEVGALVDLLIAAGLFNWAEGAKQLAAGSDFLFELNEQLDPTPGDVRYVAIGTREDEVTKPVARSGIPGGENVVMQEACPERSVGHFGLLEDAWVLQVVVSVLAGGPAEGDCDALPLGGSS